ncbi:MAG: 4Fe-4S binding protein [Coriobacteriales bacterium]|nr:4Fe-4S binding protein [Coriobacteriales bacterium]
MAIAIEKDVCIGCGACVGACPVSIIEVEDVAIITDEASCIECGSCVDACPVSAITL